MVTDLRSHVRAVQETGETLRRETATLVTALRKPQTRGAWGRHSSNGPPRSPA